MRSMTFRVDDQSASTTPQPAIWVTLEEQPDGTVRMSVRIEGNVTGDLRGVFFDVADESLLGSIQATSDGNLSSVRQGNDSVRDLGNGANMNGLTGSDGGFDVGLEIGSAGIGKDDIQSFSTVLSSSTRALTLDDFANVDFGVRTTSVGTVGSKRADSSKLMETTFTPINAQDDSAVVDENTSVGGNLLTNDRAGLAAGDTVTVTQWSGGALGETILLANTAGATLTVQGDGSYLLDAQASDALSEGESFSFSYTYTARNVNEATASASDTATFTVTVKGVNDGPDAVNDDAGSIAEGDSVSGNVLGNDSDIDRLDVISVTGVLDGNGQPVLGDSVTLASGATVQISANGNYTYDTGHAFDSLLAGQTATDTFTYQIADGHGGYDTATVTVHILGSGTVNPGGGGGGSTPPPNDFPTLSQDLSNVVLYLDDGNPGTTGLLKVKIEASGMGVRDVDDLNLAQFFSTHQTELGGYTRLVAASIHAGQEYPNVAGQDGTANGEGVFYLLGDSTPIDPVGTRGTSGGWTQDWTQDDYPLTPEAQALGLTPALLSQQASQTYTYDGSW